MKAYFLPRQRPPLPPIGPDAADTLPDKGGRPRHSSELPYMDWLRGLEWVILSLWLGFSVGVLAGTEIESRLDRIVFAWIGLLLLFMVVLAINTWRRWRMDRRYWHHLDKVIQMGHEQQPANPHAPPKPTPQSPSDDTGGNPS